MDILPLHIEYLLTRHDCVIVPGLGAFIATEKEAYIDFERDVICPRRREISFNGSVVTDDGLLAHSIARREGIAYEDARRLEATLTDRMKSDLENEGEVTLGMIGKLVFDTEGLISFIPRHSVVTSDVVPDIALKKNTDITMSVTAGSAEEIPEKSYVDADGMRTIRVKADRYVFTVSKRAVHAAAMFVTILTVGLSLLLPINHDNEQKASVISIQELFRQRIKPDNLRLLEDGDFDAGENLDSIAASVTSTL